MYQAGEVDYLVATDAIGMGLNMDVDHVAFAGLAKFDGSRRRRLTAAEMAQIAGRAGRHQRDGTLRHADASRATRSPNSAPRRSSAIEEHRFAPLDFLYWRESELDFASVEALIALARAPAGPARAARRARGDRPRRAQAARRRSARSRARAAAPELVRRLWAACGLPDFRKTGPEHHARLVAPPLQLHLSEGDGHIPHGWYRRARSPGSTMSRAISTRSPTASPGCAPGPISPTAPTGSPIPRRWPSGRMAVEEKLSDALHERLTQRFVDRRTAVLMRDIGSKGAGEFPVIDRRRGRGQRRLLCRSGGCSGFAFEVDPAARHADRKMLLATAERRLGGEYEKRAAALVADSDDHFALRTEAGAAGRDPLARPRGRAARPGQEPAQPAHPARPAARPRLGQGPRGGDRAAQGLAARPAPRRCSAPLRAAGRAAQDPAAPAAVRALLAMLVDEGGIVARDGGRRAARRARPRAAPRRHPARRPDRRARPVHARRAEARGDALARRLARRRGRRSRCRRCRRRRASSLPTPRRPLCWPGSASAGRAADDPRSTWPSGIAAHAHEARAAGGEAGRPRAGHLARPRSPRRSPS